MGGPALPVTDFGIVAIGTDSSDWVGRYTMLDPTGIRIEKETWDFWPSYALANLVTYQDPPPPPPILPFCSDPKGKRCAKWIEVLSKAICKEKQETGASGRNAPTSPTLITREELWGTGIDLNNDLKVDAVAGGGSLIFASDRSAPPHRARLGGAEADSGQ